LVQLPTSLMADDEGSDVGPEAEHDEEAEAGVEAESSDEEQEDPELLSPAADELFQNSALPSDLACLVFHTIFHTLHKLLDGDCNSNKMCCGRAVRSGYSVLDGTSDEQRESWPRCKICFPPGQL
jgi:hypothetical protein